jgi:hypothetical protein
MRAPQAPLTTSILIMLPSQKLRVMPDHLAES